MSYSGYNQFSPYYQPPQQTSQQNNSSSNTGGAYSSDSSFQPLSAYQSEQQRQQQQQQQQQQHQSHNQSSHQSNSNYDPQGYGNNSVTSAQAALSYGNQNYGGLGSSSGRNNDPSNTYASSRPDTTALGNLAYASSLGPEQQRQQQQSSLSQLIDYNRSRSGYGTSGGYGGTSDTNPSHQRVHSQSSNQQPTNGLPYTTTYQTSNTLPAYSSQSYALNNTGRSSPAQHQYSNSSHPVQPNQASYYQNNHPPQPARPATGKAMPRPNSQASARATHSPQVSAVQANQSSGHIGADYRYASNTSTTGGQQARNNASPAQPQPAHGPPASRTQSRSSATSTTQSNQSRMLSNSQAQTAKQPDGRSTPSEPASGNSNWSAPPVTVNPNQIFNHSEWERRQEGEKAERLARAASAATKTPGDDVTQAAKALVSQSASASSESTTKEQIELEMKQMIEKMRDYKAKDPSLFSQVWEEVKKVRLNPYQVGPS